MGWLTLPLLFATLVSLRVKTSNDANDAIVVEPVLLKEGKVLSRAIHFIDKNYVDPQRVRPERMIEQAARNLERGVAPLIIHREKKGWEARMGGKVVLLPSSRPATLDDVASTTGGFLGFTGMYHKGRLDETDRLTLAMSGIVESLDTHSNYLPPKVYNEFKIGTKGNFGGLGIVIGIRDGDLTVISPLEDTPAFKAGIKAKDKIVQIGEESTINMGLTEAVEKLRGAVGSQVSVMIQRSGVATPLQFTLRRALIHIQSVAGRLITGPDGKKTALMKVKNFQEDTFDQLNKTLRRFRAEASSMEGVILDLRNDPGGLLDQAVQLADFFLSEGVIVKTVGAQGETLEVEKATRGDEGEGLPLVVLVNEGSASASEIVAGALQMNNRAVVIGSRTFGKGSVQTVYDLKDGSALKLTIAKYLTAQDREVQSVGIVPDVGLVPASVGEEVVDLYEDAKKREIDLMEEEEEEQTSSSHFLPPPEIQMTYFSKEEGKGDDEEVSAKIRLDDDFPVHFADRILRLPEAKTLKRGPVIDTLSPLLERLKGEETAKIEKAMGKIGIDWKATDASSSVEKKRARPAGVATLEMLDESGKGVRQGLAAGSSGFLRLVFENRGKDPLFRLAGVTKSEDPLFANLEFPLGRVNPQEKREWKTPFKAPDFASRRSVPVEIEFREAFGSAPKTESVFLSIEEPPMPSFEYRYLLLDNGAEGTRGNGDGRAQPGETVGLKITVRNKGTAESRNPVANLKNEEGQDVFLEKGRATFSPILPQGEESGLIRIRIPKDGKKNKRLVFDLNVSDIHLGAELTDRLEIPIDKDKEPPVPPQGLDQIPPVVALSPSIPILVSKFRTYHIKGSASDDHEIRHLFIFVGDEKAFYQAPPAPGRLLDFSTGVPLKKGINFITIAAQDDRELTTRKQWIVWRE